MNIGFIFEDWDTITPAKNSTSASSKNAWNAAIRCPSCIQAI